MSAHPWVDVTWDHIQPGDRVLSPDGETEFHVTARIDMPDDPELSFQLAALGDLGDGDFWTDRPRNGEQTVKGWRFSDSPKIPGAEAFAIGRLRLAGFDVDVISE